MPNDDRFFHPKHVATASDRSIDYILCFDWRLNVLSSFELCQRLTTCGLRTPEDSEGHFKEGGQNLFQGTRELTHICSTSCFSNRPLLSSVTFCSSRPRWPIACWYYGFESRRGYECISLVIVVCCQVEVSATDRSLIQRSPTNCAMSNWVWSWSLDIEEALAHWAPSKKMF